MEELQTWIYMTWHINLFLFTCKLSIIWLLSADRREHIKKSITWRYVELRDSDVENVTSPGYNGVNVILKASLLFNI